MKESTKKTAAIVGAAGATMAAAAGAYYLYGSKNAAQHRRKAKAWMRKAEREIVHEAKKLKNKTFTEANIRRVIDEVAKRYEAAKDIEPEDVRQFVAAVQKSWSSAGNTVKGRSSKGRTKSTRKKTRT